MQLRHRLLVYLVAVHLAGLGVAAWFHAELGNWFFAIEAALICSFLVGYRLIDHALAPLNFIQAFSDVLKEREFSSRFSTVGMPEMDELIRTYNRMLDNLYRERIQIGEQRGFVERFLQATNVGVLVFDFDGRITLANAAAAGFLGIERDSLYGRTLRQLDGDLARRLTAPDLGAGEMVHLGARRFRVERQAFLDRGFERTFLVIEELTAILHESERAAYQKLIRLMSHEVNNTVAATNSLLESCTHYAPQLAQDDREDFLSALSVVVKRNAHLNHFMRDFAEVVRLPSPKPRSTDLNQILDSLSLVFREQCRERGIVWRRTGEMDLPEILVDAEQFEQALINVAKNAVEAIDQAGHVELVTEVKDEGVDLAIIDDGCGLDTDRQDELFTPFYSSKPNGQGLGLTLVKEVMVKHGFDYSLSSQDGRTAFRVQIPRADKG
ncbi:MAG: ATP-binding protein [Xanthomonadales bacterium]|nr:ATP-binding protein [Xanthomonadales bacterium]